MTRLQELANMAIREMSEAKAEDALTSALNRAFAPISVKNLATTTSLIFKLVGASDFTRESAKVQFVGIGVRPETAHALVEELAVRT